MKPSFLDTEPLWSARERYSGKTQEIIERAVRECGSDANHPGIKILVNVMAWLTIPLAHRSKYWDQRCGRLQNCPQLHIFPIPGCALAKAHGESSVYPVMGPAQYTLDDFMLVWDWDRNELRLTPYPPDQTCRHCHTREPQTGKRRLNRCDVCGVNLW